MNSGKPIRVEVAYGLPDRQVLIEIAVDADCSVQSAIEQSGILEEFPEIDLKINRVGIFGTPCALDRKLQPGERVEIYRPLLQDPKESRRIRARQQASRKS